MTLRLVAHALCACMLLAASASAQVTAPPGPPPTPPATSPPGSATGAPSSTLGCNVDPAIARLVLTKPHANSYNIRVSYEIRNLGHNAWSARADQHRVRLWAQNPATREWYLLDDRALPASAAAGALMMQYTSPPLIPPQARALRLHIAIFSTANYPCDGNANTANDALEIPPNDYLNFLQTGTRSRTFQP